LNEQLPPGTRWLTEVDAGRTVELRMGDRLSVNLGGNPTTGYSWELSAVNQRVLAPLGEPGYRASSPAVGAGGVFAFEFEAIAAGRTALRLVYRRPWEKRRPAQTFRVSITVG
jgi:inhibitor of cysteine peptidase